MVLNFLNYSKWNIKNNFLGWPLWLGLAEFEIISFKTYIEKLWLEKITQPENSTKIFSMRKKMKELNNFNIACFWTVWTVSGIPFMPFAIKITSPNVIYLFIFKFLLNKSHFVGPLTVPILDFMWPLPWVSKPGWFSNLHTYLLVGGEPQSHICGATPFPPMGIRAELLQKVIMLIYYLRTDTVFSSWRKKNILKNIDSYSQTPALTYQIGY